MNNDTVDYGDEGDDMEQPEEVRPCPTCGQVPCDHEYDEEGWCPKCEALDPRRYPPELW